MNAPIERKASALLIVGIVLLPILFAWFTLRNGYSLLARGLAFGWLVLILILVASAPKVPQSADLDRGSSISPSVAIYVQDPATWSKLFVQKIWACNEFNSEGKQTGGGQTGYYRFFDDNGHQFVSVRRPPAFSSGLI